MGQILPFPTREQKKPIYSLMHVITMEDGTYELTVWNSEDGHVYLFSSDRGFQLTVELDETVYDSFTAAFYACDRFAVRQSKYN